jgi:hypothetical protein
MPDIWVQKSVALRDFTPFPYEPKHCFHNYKLTYLLVYRIRLNAFIPFHYHALFARRKHM